MFTSQSKSCLDKLFEWLDFEDAGGFVGNEVWVILLAGTVDPTKDVSRLSVSFIDA